jgi:hypothetical protein
MVTNLGEEDKPTIGSLGNNYKVSPVETTLAFKGGYSFAEKFYTELKAKYIISKGDNSDNTAAAVWGRLAVEPYFSYQMVDFVKFQFLVNITTYFNSYYLALETSPPGGPGAIPPGQVPSYPSALDYYSQYQLSVEPSIVFSVFKGGTIVAGYQGDYSRDHIRNNMYVDFRWSF